MLPPVRVQRLIHARCLPHFARRLERKGFGSPGNRAAVVSELTTVKTGGCLLKIDDLQNIKKLLKLGAGGNIHHFHFARVVGVCVRNEHAL